MVKRIFGNILQISIYKTLFFQKNELFGRWAPNVLCTLWWGLAQKNTSFMPGPSGPRIFLLLWVPTLPTGTVSLPWMNWVFIYVMSKRLRTTHTILHQCTYNFRKKNSSSIMGTILNKLKMKSRPIVHKDLKTSAVFY